MMIRQLSAWAAISICLAQAQWAEAADYGASGFDKSGMDLTVKPGDDFWQYANGAWARDVKMPADQFAYGVAIELTELSRQRTREVLEAARKIAGSKTGAAYSAYLDEATIESEGLGPIRPWLTKVRSLASKQGLPALLADASRNGIPTPFKVSVKQDDKAPDSYVLNIDQAGLGMPDRDYYVGSAPQGEQVRQAYLAHLTKILQIAGESEAAARAQAVLDFETAIANGHWSRTEARDVSKTYNKVTFAELRKNAPGFDLTSYLRAIGASSDEVVLGQPSAIYAEAKQLAAAPLRVIKDQLLIRSLETFAEVLPSELDRQTFAFYGSILSGTPEQEPRWKRGVDFTSRILADDVSKDYVARFFPPATKALAKEMVDNIVAAMGARIDRLEWMTPQTKQKARTKLAAFTAKIGYPDRWRDYSALEIRRDDAFGNALRANQWLHDYEMGKLGKPIYRWEWALTPMTVNAYANYTGVEIAFPAAILQPPAFNPNVDPAVNYGAIGVVIGHEISHHFDDQGGKYDASGRLNNWWTEQDLAAFKRRTEAVIEQYAAYEALPGLNINGALTLGENVADLAGIALAYDAYVASLKGKQAPVIDGLTGDQRFFLGWAQGWRWVIREPALRHQVMTDPHTPPHQRVWVVRNLDSWYAAFGVQAGDELHLPEQQRLRIW
jgi:Predicted metalloendopeptidase|nr:M13 family metallopeptidase [uncultured Steroidobacter sp.]